MGGFGEDATLDATIAALEGVTHVLCAKIGDCPKDMLVAAGIEATDAYAYEYAETAISALYAEAIADSERSEGGRVNRPTTFRRASRRLT